MDERDVICPDCLKDLNRTEQATMRGNNTEELFDYNVKFIHGASFMWVEPGSKELDLIHQMKYGPFANPHIAFKLGQVLATEFMESGFFEDIQYILPVPLHPKRLRERGFNQSEWLCRGISDVTGIPTDTEHLYRARNNDHQARLAGTDRRKNTKGVFAVRYPEDFYRLHVLLVDDLITTGSTLRGCIDAIRPIRECQFSVLGLGRARH